MRAALLLAAVLLAGCLGGGSAAETPAPTPTPTAEPTPAPTPTPTPTPDQWDLATEAGSGVVYEGQVATVTRYVRVAESGTVVVDARGDPSQRLRVHYAPEGEAPETVTIDGDGEHRVAVTPGAWGFELQATGARKVPVRVVLAG